MLSTLVVLEDCCVEILLKLVTILAMHDDAVLRLANLLLRLNALHLILLLTELTICLRVS